ncbi:LicD family-domain-containing protein [Diplogelasinospora grovesii]|uniref:LicD family-domain-containing protein n=1 Tax=Diplogelasinospora grovesii TaxID=303347 RepID=A0AAN6NLU3_9PEZI|nr:LicD family-domain-containing protein [Diplogelasinospora grovesii]
MHLLQSLPLQTLLLLSSLLSPVSSTPTPPVLPPPSAPPTGGGGGESLQDRSAHLSTHVNPPGPPPASFQFRPQVVEDKYFQEPGGSEVLGHYDARFFRGIVEYDAHRPALRHLIRSYLTTFRRLGVETWLAHGTLLGWWWNGRVMPWDYDLDVQVSASTLTYLTEAGYNRTYHEYRYVDDDNTGQEQTKTYLLDINPWHTTKERLQGQNVIDARWVDISNGMFIDITGLRERDPEYAPGIWSCKNYHRYRTRDLYPMRESEFEGVTATIPFDFEKVLIQEYGTKSLVATEWEG